MLRRKHRPGFAPYLPGGRVTCRGDLALGRVSTMNLCSSPEGGEAALPPDYDRNLLHARVALAAHATVVHLQHAGTLGVGRIGDVNAPTVRPLNRGRVCPRHLGVAAVSRVTG